MTVLCYPMVGVYLMDEMEFEARVADMLSEMEVPPSAASAWLDEYRVPGYGGKTPRQIARQFGPQAVYDYIEAVRAGVYA